MAKAECIWQRASELGEGARYDPDTDSVWWVDILGQSIMRLCLKDGLKSEWRAPTTVGTTFSSFDGRILALLRHTLADFQPSDGSFLTLVAFPEEPASNRFNDGVVGPDGHVWLASMDFDCAAPSGRLYSVDPSGLATSRDDGYVVANGPVISADGRTLFSNETMRGLIFAHVRDPYTNELRNKRVFAEIASTEGLPDGLAVDTEGGLWVALVTGGRVRRYRPDGSLHFDIPLPTPITTSVAFGGPHRSTLFVTTGRILLTPSELEAHPTSGSLFQIDVDFQGAPSPRARLTAFGAQQ